MDDVTIEELRNALKRMLRRAMRETLRAIESGEREAVIDLSDELPFEGRLTLGVRLGDEDEQQR